MLNDDGYTTSEPQEYEGAIEYRRELEPRAIIAEREAVRTAFIQDAQRHAAAPARPAPAVSVGTIPTAAGVAAAMINPWVTSDGRFFGSDADARQHQRTIDERAARQAARVAAAELRAQSHARKSA